MNYNQHRLNDICIKATEDSKPISENLYNFWMDGTTQIINNKVTSERFHNWLIELADYYAPKDRIFATYILELSNTYNQSLTNN